MIFSTAKIEWLDALIADQSADWRVHLFVNNIEPTDDDTAYTEPSFASYVVTTPSSWSAAALNGTCGVVSQADEISFTDTEAEVVYGWYMMNDSSGLVLMADRFAEPIDMTAGGTVELTPTLLIF